MPLPPLLNPKEMDAGVGPRLEEGIGAAGLGEVPVPESPTCSNTAARLPPSRLIGAAAAGVITQVEGLTDGIAPAGLAEGAAAVIADVLVIGREAAPLQVEGAAAGGAIAEHDIAAGPRVLVPPVWVKVPVP